MTRLLLIINVIVFLVYWLSTQNIVLDERFAIEIAGSDTVPGKFVMIPIDILQGQRLYTLLTSMFMHAGWIHLLGNMLFLYIFGDNVEDAFGHVSYLFFYLFCGVMASLAQIWYSLYFGGLMDGVIGASGAISGVLGAYAVLYPKARILAFVSYFILPVPAIIFLGFWFAMQWLLGFFDASGGVAYWAHIGGFTTGVILGLTVGRERKKARDKRQSL